MAIQHLVKIITEQHYSTKRKVEKIVPIDIWYEFLDGQYNMKSIDTNGKPVTIENGGINLQLFASKLNKLKEFGFAYNDFLSEWYCVDIERCKKIQNILSGSN